MFSGGFSDGKATGKISSGISSLYDDGNVHNDVNSTSTGNKEDTHYNDKKIHTGADYRSAMHAFKASGGNESDLDGFVDFVSNSQLSESHKKNIFGHVAASLAEATGMEQEEAEMTVAAVGAGAGTIALNKMMGNPIGKTASAGTKHAKKLFGDNTSNETESVSNSENSNNTNDDSVNDGKSSKHDDSFNHLDNYNKKIKETQEKFNTEGQKLQGLQKTQTHLASRLKNIDYEITYAEFGDSDKYGQKFNRLIAEESKLNNEYNKVSSQIQTSQSKMSEYSNTLDNLEMEKQNLEGRLLDGGDSHKNTNIDSNKNSFSAKGGLLGTVVALGHSFPSFPISRLGMHIITTNTQPI